MSHTSSLRSSLMQVGETFLSFEKKMRTRYKYASEDIGEYILVRMSMEKEGTKRHQKWVMYWNEYCGYLDEKSRLSSKLTTANHRRSMNVLTQ